MNGIDKINHLTHAHTNITLVSDICITLIKKNRKTVKHISFSFKKIIEGQLYCFEYNKHDKQCNN